MENLRDGREENILLTYVYAMVDLEFRLRKQNKTDVNTHQRRPGARRVGSRLVARPAWGGGAEPMLKLGAESAAPAPKTKAPLPLPLVAGSPPVAKAGEDGCELKLKGLELFTVGVVAWNVNGVVGRLSFCNGCDGWTGELNGLDGVVTANGVVC